MLYRKLFNFILFNITCIWRDSSTTLGKYLKGISMMLILFYQSLLDRYSWYLNGSQIKDNTEIVAIKNTGELLISKICTYQLLGIFYCIAENKYGSTMSPFVKISELGNLSINFYMRFRKKTCKMTNLMF